MVGYASSVGARIRIKTMKSIDLGRETSFPVSLLSKDADDEKSVEYPTLYLVLEDGQDLAKLPYEGTMTVKFCVKRDDRNVKKGERQIEMDVEEILDIKPENAKTLTAEEQFDKVAAEVRGEETDEGGDEDAEE
jgi:hypothetical protein